MGVARNYGYLTATHSIATVGLKGYQRRMAGGRNPMERLPTRAYVLSVWLISMLGVAQAQTMGARSNSTGNIQVPVTTTSVGTTTYGSKSLNVVNQGGNPVVPSYTFNLPELPKATPPQQPFQTPKPFDPDLGPFEANRP
jgi:hypothetical protein